MSKHLIVATESVGYEQALYVDGKLSLSDDTAVFAVDIADVAGNGEIRFSHVNVEGGFDEWPEDFGDLKPDDGSRAMSCSRAGVVASLREAADRIEAAGEPIDDSHIDVQIAFHRIGGQKDCLRSILAIADEGTIDQCKSEDFHWASFQIMQVGVAAFFDPEVLDKVKKAVRTTHTTTTGKVTDLLTETEAET